MTRNGGTDIHIYDWMPYAQARIWPPMVFGHEFCGEVVEVGRQVIRIQVGDLVTGEAHIPCGHCFQCQTGNQHICENMAILGVHTNGAFAEYALPHKGLCVEAGPWHFSRTGAILEPLGVAVHGVLVDRVDGRSVAVFGCGPIGLFALGVAAACGATRLIAVEVNSSRLSMAPSMAPNAVLVHAGEQDPMQAILAATGGRVMWDTWWQMDALLKAGRRDPLPVITHRFPLDQIHEAMALAKSGQAGKILLLPSEGSAADTRRLYKGGASFV